MSGINSSTKSARQISVWVPRDDDLPGYQTINTLVYDVNVVGDGRAYTRGWIIYKGQPQIVVDKRGYWQIEFKPKRCVYRTWFEKNILSKWTGHAALIDCRMQK